MAEVTLKGNKAKVYGDLPAKGKKAPAFTLTDINLSDVSISDFRGKKLILNIFPSVDTGVCAMSVRKFNEELSNLENTVVLCISMDLPFAQKRFCGAEGIENVRMLSVFRNKEFAIDYGVEVLEGPFKGLLARSIVVIDTDGTVVYNQLVPEIGQEPDYDSALKAL